jgi:uncharacterized repeat protein (TIGR04138 family)
MDDWQAMAEYDVGIEKQLDAMGETQYAREAYEFALEVIEHAPNYYEGLPTPPPFHRVHFHLTAEDYACCYLLHAKEVFEQPLEMLTTWGLRTSNDIGNVVYELVAAGLIIKRDGDSHEQFHGLFDIAQELGAG